MSDWRNRAKPVNDDGGWKSRSIPVYGEENPRPVDGKELHLPPEGSAVLREWASKGGSQQAEAGARAMTRGALNTATLGFGDELQGALTAAAAKIHPDLARLLNSTDITNPTGDEPTTYAGGRDLARRENAKSRADYPVMSTAGDLIGGVALPGGVAKSLPRALARAAALGGAFGAGNSEADLTKGDVGGLLKDSGIGALISGGVSGAGYGLSKAAGPVANFIQGKIAAAKGDADQLATKKIEDEVETLLGKYRSGVQSASRDLEVLGREADRGALPSAEEAKALLNSERGQAIREAVLQGKLESAPSRIAEMQALKDAYTALKANATTATQEAAADMLKDPVRRRLLPKALTYMSRTVPAMVAGTAGSAIGGPAGAVAGSAIGGAVGTVMGKPGTAIGNEIRHPGTRNAFWQLLNQAARPTATTGTALQSVAPVSSQELMRLLMDEGDGETEH